MKNKAKEKILTKVIKQNNKTLSKIKNISSIITVILLISIITAFIMSTMFLNTESISHFFSQIKEYSDENTKLLSNDVATIATEQTNNQLEKVENLIGKYQFNMTGGSSFLTKNGEYSHIPEMSEYESNHSSTLLSNSSGGYLSEEYNQGGSIYKAYLVIESSSDGCYNASNKTYNNNEGLNHWPVTIVGNNSTLTKAADVYCYSGSNIRRMGYIDITEFVKENGYGWYYVCNVPYDKTNQMSGNDAFAGWKMIVIEENEKLPSRVLELALGCVATSGVHSGASLTINLEGLKTYQTGTVTGQLLYSLAGSDPNANTQNNAIKYGYSTTDNIPTDTLKSITTSNSVRTPLNPLTFIYSRNGVPLSSEGHSKSIYKTPNYFIPSTITYTSSKPSSGTYYETDSSDIELLDIDGLTTKHDVKYGNSMKTIGLYFETVTGVALISDILGIVVDIDTPTFSSQQTTTLNSETELTTGATVTGKVTNTTAASDIGLKEETFTIGIDKGLTIDSYTVKVYASSADTTGRTITGTIDRTNNTITFKDANLNVRGSYIDYTVNCTKNDTARTKFTNEARLSGYYFNVVETDKYITGATYVTSSAIPIYRLTIDPNSGVWDDSGTTSIIDLKSGEKHTIQVPTRQGYIFDGWTLTGAGSSMADLKTESEFTMGSTNATLQAKWIPDPNNTYTVNYWQQKLGKPDKPENNENYDLYEHIDGTADTDSEVTPPVKPYDGFVSPVAKTETIAPDGSTVIDYYYTRRNDLSYTVNYIDDDTKAPIQNPKTMENQVFGSIIDAQKEKVEFEKYNFKSISTESLEITTGTNEINIYYTKKAGSVVIHHYIDKTETQVPSNELGKNVEDETQSGKVDDAYTTNISSKIAPNYKYSHVDISGAPGATEENGTVTGKMAIGEIQITYYYVLKDSDTTCSISKEGTEKITEKDEEVNYKITYRAEVDNYKGNATITIVDNLPYEIDENASELGDNAEYSKENKTITWVEQESDIDIVAEGKAHSILIEKNIKIVYSNLNTNDTSFTNRVTAEIFLEVTNQKIQASEAQKITQTDFYKNITVTKKWEHGNNKYGNPEKVTLQIKNGNDIVESQDVTVLNKVDENENIWSHTFEHLPKYNESGEVINYTIDEAEDASLEYYKKTIDEASKTITNTFVGPEISSSKSATIILGEDEPEPRDYAVEGDAIRYVITVENAGQMEKQVTIQDKIPTGTTFKTGSLEVKKGNEVVTDYKIANLTGSGIKIVVPPAVSGVNGRVTVKFDVTVNDLEDHIFEEQVQNTATVDGKNTDTITTDVKKPNISIRKTALPEAGSKVTTGEKITYSISVRNTGTAPETAIIKDTIPVGTTFVPESIKVDGVEEKDLKETDLANGIEVTVDEGASEIVEFAVTVNDLEDGDEIINVAKVDEHPLHHGNIERETKEVIHKFVEPQISVNKTVETEKSKSYVIAGERMTYSIILENAGGLEKEVLVKDSIPNGTTYVGGTLRVIGQAVEQTYDIAQLTGEGIRVTVPSAITNEENEETQKTNGKVTIMFDVTVNSEVTGDISNGATINKTPENPELAENTNKVKVPILTYSKEVEIVQRGNVQLELQPNQVTVGDTIKYIIKVNNTGSQKIQNVAVEDTIPSGLEILNKSEMVEDGALDVDDGKKEGNKVNWKIDLEANTSKTINIIAEVKHSTKEYTIENTALVDGNRTNTTQSPYREPGIELESNIEKKALTEKIITKDTSIYYEIKFTANIQYFEGRAKITMVDTLPYPIDEGASSIADATYKEDTANEKYTLTWEEYVDGINTFKSWEPMQITKTKALQLKYKYGNLDNNSGEMINKITSNIELQTPTEDPAKYEKIKEQEQNSQAEVLIELPAQVIVHHYIYDDQKGGNTDIKLIADETKQGLVGKEYELELSKAVPSNYICKNATPDGYKGKFTEEVIHVNYYYELDTPEFSNTITKTVTMPQNSSNNLRGATFQLVKEDELAPYTIDYTVNISKYIGKVSIEIVDTLPAKIDITKSKLGEDAVYNEENNTITWTEEIEGIDTYNQSGQYAGGKYTDGIYTKHIIKQIEVLYKGQDVLADLENTVNATAKIYYPEKHSSNAGEIQKQTTANATQTIGQDYRVNIKVIKEWDDNNNLKEHRPEAIKIKIAGDGNKIEQTLNESNNWTYEAEKLPVYNSAGKKIDYVVTESEAKQGDLSYYDEAVITKTQTEDKSTSIYNIRNAHKVLKSNFKTTITKTASNQISDRNQKVEYTIKLHTEINDCLGDGKIIIVDTLPYKINERRSELDGGKYNNDTQTITWEKQLKDIDTIANGTYICDETKSISLLYIGIDATKEKLENTVRGKVQLFETNQADEATASASTKININGRVIVKYLDVETDEPVAEQKIITGKVGTSYTTFKATEDELQPNYEYVEDREPENKEGTISEEDTYVIYYYHMPRGNVIVKHLDIDTKEPIAEDEIITQKVQTICKTSELSAEILNDRYEYVLEAGPENKEVTVTKEDTYVTYYYRRVKGTVIAKYLEKGTNSELLKQEEIIGNVGESYSTERKVIKNYKSAEPEPSNKIGIFTKEPIEVIYYYEKIPSGVLSVKYMDIDTGTEIKYKEEKEDGTIEEKTYKYEISGNVGDKYEAQQKQIPYYKFVKAVGEVQGELTENSETIIFYYQKLNFNFSIEQELKQVLLNGGAKNINNKESIKIEIVASEIGSSKLQVTYLITVTNNGEIDGKAKVVESIPKGFKLASSESYWTKGADGDLETLVELKVGETKQLELQVEWINGDSNFGIFENEVKIVSTENEAKFDETNFEDNISSTEIITSIKTGIEMSLDIRIAIIVISGILGMLVILKKILKIRMLTYLYKK